MTFAGVTHGLGGGHMKRIALALGLAASLALPGTVLAFHHGGLPATVCHAPAAGSPSKQLVVGQVSTV